MAAHLITGYKGSEHIQSADARSFNMAMFGGGEFVMEIGEQLDASITNNNTVRILDGDILMQGGHIRIKTGTYEDMTIETGTAGKSRIDLIVMTYEKNALDGTEKAYLEVIKGTPTEGTPTDPAYVQGTLAEGDLKNQMPLYRVKVEGVVLTSLEVLFKTIPTYKTIAEQYAAQFQKACDTYLGALNVLDTMEEVNANTQANQLAGALAVKEGISSLNLKMESVRSHVGMIIQSTTLDTEAKVIAIYGGTSWTKIEGRFLLGTSPSYAVNATGGEATHKLTTPEMPSHSHGLNNHTHTIPALSGTTNTAGSHTHNSKNYWVANSGKGAAGYCGGSGTSAVLGDLNDIMYASGSHSHTVTTKSNTTSGNSGSTATTGSGTAHNNMPPYKAVYIWERTA